MDISPELIGYFAAFLTTASFLPQAIKTIKTQATASLSVGMYAMFTLGVLLWLIYGIYLQNNAIIIANAITFCLSAMILAVKLYNMLCNKDHY